MIYIKQTKLFFFIINNKFMYYHKWNYFKKKKFRIINMYHKKIFRLIGTI